jgi:hypothetical protein
VTTAGSPSRTYPIVTNDEFPFCVNVTLDSRTTGAAESAKVKNTE